MIGAETTPPEADASRRGGASEWTMLHHLEDRAGGPRAAAGAVPRRGNSCGTRQTRRLVSVMFHVEHGFACRRASSLHHLGTSERTISASQARSRSIIIAGCR